MNPVDTVLIDDRQQHGHKHQLCGNTLDHATDQQDEHQHQRQEHVLVIGEIKQETAEMLRHLIDRKKPSHRC